MASTASRAKGSIAVWAYHRCGLGLSCGFALTTGSRSRISIEMTAPAPGRFRYGVAGQIYLLLGAQPL